MTFPARRIFSFPALLCLLIAQMEAAAAELEWRVLDRYPQSREHFVQGLEINGGYLYISAGGYGESQLLRYRFPGGNLEARRNLAARFFAEGLTLLNGEVFQLTWRSGRVPVYDPLRLEPLRELRIGTEGWGLTNDGSHLIYSDGSAVLRVLDPQSGDVLRHIEVRHRGRPVARLNELEWIDGKIWANIWLTDRIVIIDPASGRVSDTLDLTGLLPANQRQPDTDVLNGIAEDPRDGAIWVTGKRWPWMYRLEILRPAS